MITKIRNTLTLKSVKTSRKTIYVHTVPTYDVFLQFKFYAILFMHIKMCITLYRLVIIITTPLRQTIINNNNPSRIVLLYT